MPGSTIGAVWWKLEPGVAIINYELYWAIDFYYLIILQLLAGGKNKQVNLVSFWEKIEELFFLCDRKRFCMWDLYSGTREHAAQLKMEEYTKDALQEFQINIVNYMTAQIAEVKALFSGWIGKEKDLKTPVHPIEAEAAPERMTLSVVRKEGKTPKKEARITNLYGEREGQVGEGCLLYTSPSPRD